jgi:hypothetical protein
MNEMNGKYNYELIKDYLDGILDTNTSNRVKALINNDENARAIAKGVLLLQQKSENDEAIDKYFDNLLSSQQKVINQNIKSRTPFSWLKIAAVITLLAVSSLVVYRLSQPDLIDLVERELAVPYKSSVTLRDSENVVNDGILAYNSGDYKTASELLKKSTSTEEVFFYGLSELYLKNYERAIVPLNGAELTDSRFEEQGRWYLALAYILANDELSAKATLMKIVVRKSHYKYHNARRLLDQMGG